MISPDAPWRAPTAGVVSRLCKEAILASGLLPSPHAQISREWEALANDHPDGFEVIEADPPWHFGTYSGKGQGKSPSQHYPTLHPFEVAALPLPLLFARPSVVLYLWTTMPHLHWSMMCCDVWGLTYRSHRTWVKPEAQNPGTGYWARQHHEVLLIAGKGSGLCPKPPVRPNSQIRAPKREHSQKPDAAYDQIARAHPGRRKLSLFSRCERPGWVCWGNEKDKFQALEAAQ